MHENIEVLQSGFLWKKLKEIPQPPKMLYIRGDLGGGPFGPATSNHKYITIVGSRRCSEYAKQVTEEICRSLAGQPVTIVSGLATGIDSHAHKCALKYNLHTIAVLACGLSDKTLQLHSNYRLAQKILDADSALISEYEQLQTSRSWMFPARNRIMVGLADLVIVIEAREKSGTRITARMATDYNRDLLVIPNSIYSSFSKGSNELIKQGAYVYTCPEDIFNLLGFEYSESKLNNYTPTSTEAHILDALAQSKSTTQEIIEFTQSKCIVSEVIQSLLNLEIEGVIKRVDGKYVIL